MRFELFIASRYLRAKRRQAVIGVITAISVVGVMAGVASLIVALAINNGFRQDLQDRLLGSTAHAMRTTMSMGAFMTSPRRARIPMSTGVPALRGAARGRFQASVVELEYSCAP